MLDQIMAQIFSSKIYFHHKEFCTKQIVLPLHKKMGELKENKHILNV